MTEKKTAEGRKMVKIKLFKDNSRYKGDAYVGLNGVGYQIRRGVEVEVPEGVAEILENSEMAQQDAVNRITILTGGENREYRNLTGRKKKRAGPKGPAFGFGGRRRRK